MAAAVSSQEVSIPKIFMSKLYHGQGRMVETEERSKRRSDQSRGIRKNGRSVEFNDLVV